MTALKRASPALADAGLGKSVAPIPEIDAPLDSAAHRARQTHRALQGDAAMSDALSIVERDRRSICRRELEENLRLAAFHAGMAAEYAAIGDDAGCDYSLKKTVILIKAALAARAEREGTPAAKSLLGAGA